MLARLCSIPTNDLAMARIVLLRELAHSAAPVLQRPPIEVSTTSTRSSSAEQGLRLAPPNPETRLRGMIRRSA
jgi:hypothetical protein